MANAGALPAPYQWPRSLGLRAGDWVQIRSKEEILATLNRRGELGMMPFMPEMLQYCGQRFQVSKRAEKSCDTAHSGKARRVYDTVHLEGVRCDGSAHDGCQALCLIWWHEAWLSPVVGPDHEAPPPRQIPEATCSEENLQAATLQRGHFVSAKVYACQNTQLPRFSEELTWWSPKALAREIVRGNVGWYQASKVVLHASLNILRRRLGARPQPNIEGKCADKTPAGSLPGLQPGDWVEVKSKEEIEETLDWRQRNRGLFFDIEMLPYCGRRMRLLQKAERIVDEKKGVMISLPNDCWIMEGAVCNGYQSRDRLFCTREIHSFWREIWFSPVSDPDSHQGLSPRE